MDTYSVYLITIINLLIAGAALTFIATSNRQAPGFKSFGLGLLLVGGGLVIVVLRLLIHGKTIILVSDAVLAAGGLYLVNGARRFCGRPRIHPIVAGAIAAVFGAGIIYWLYIDNNQAMRIAITSLLFASVMIDAGIATARQVQDRSVYLLAAAGFFTDGLFLLIRFGNALGHPIAGKLLGEGPVETAHLITINFSVIVCGFALLTASNLRLKREVEALALHDPLTRLPNRRFFDERLSQAGRRASRTGERLAVVYIDLDGFKPLNDSFGHATGDAVLQTVAQRLCAGARDTDCVARLGGDEFLVLLENAPSRTDLLDLIDRLKQGVGQELYVLGRTLRLTISCGLSIYPDDVEFVGELVGGADQAMYQAKKQCGRMRVV